RRPSMRLPQEESTCGTPDQCTWRSMGPPSSSSSTATLNPMMSPGLGLPIADSAMRNSASYPVPSAKGELLANHALFTPYPEVPVGFAKVCHSKYPLLAVIANWKLFVEAFPAST